MLSWGEITIRLVLAASLGAAVGLERERKDWAAGMRTHMMVCVGAALTMMVSAFGFSDILGTAHVTLDPSRIAAQVISGIGFIGAGTILFLKQGIIKGLTTASGLWTVAAIGLAAGSGMYFAAVITTVLAIIILLVLQPLEKRISHLFHKKTLRVSLEVTVDPIKFLDKIWKAEKIKLSNFSIEKNDHELTIEMKFKNLHRDSLATILNEIQKEFQVKKMYWE
ncbi:MgtC/SapB family protein [Pseudopedobacter sp.]|uniref:MgtC/SapB family protein n=1 Tax=Pseudopedobacter sp. TaxID=1936787 RepID=UPI003341B00C